MRYRWMPWLAAALFGAVVLRLSRGFTLDTWDGIIALQNALMVTRSIDPSTFGGLSCTRPPVGWLLASPLVAWGFQHGGRMAALGLFQSLMTAATAALLAVCFRLNARFVSPRAAALALAAMAVNPLLIQFAPFITMDLIAPYALLLFLWAAYRYDLKPGAGTFAALFGAYVAAFLTKFHLGAVIAIPLAYPLLDPRARGGRLARLRRFLLNPLWVMPPLCWLAALAAWSLLGRAAEPGALRPLSQIHHALWTALTGNVGVAAGGQSFFSLDRLLFYPLALGYQLGWPLFAAAALGVAVWISSRDPARLHAALALCVMLGLMMVFWKIPYAHYLFALTPLVYAALAQGLEELLRRRLSAARARAAALAVFAAVLPWSHAAAGVDYLRSFAPLRSSVPERLARAVEAAAAPGECVTWQEGEIIFPLSGLPYEAQPLLLGGSTFGFYTDRVVVGPRDAGARSECAPTVSIVPRDWPNSARRPPRWEDPSVARVYRQPSGKLLAEIGP